MAQTAHASHCRGSPQGDYQRHRPEQTALYQVVAANWPKFLQRAQEAGGVPDFVKREFEAYLDCGRLEKGHVLARCPSCGFEREVAFSCKKRGGICPSCMGRRMNDTAVHLVDRVLPLTTPIRQWVCSMPHSLRYLMGYDKKLCADILSVYASELMHSYKLRAKHLLWLRSAQDAHTGAVTIVQRFDSALRLNVHPHTLLIDGVYVQESDQLAYYPLPAPTHAEVATVAGRIAERAEAVMRKHGRWVDGDSADSERDPLSLEQPVLSACYQGCAQGIDVLSSRAGRPTLRLMTTPPVLSTSAEPGPVAVVRGFNLHAATAVDGCDRDRLERLCQYIGRPPIAQDRLHILDDGKVRYDMKRVWADGTRAIVLDPLDFIARLCALVPPPYLHMIRFHGLLAPNCSLRNQVVPACPSTTIATAEPQLPAQLELWDTNADRDRQTKPYACGRHPWAWLLKRVFKEDVTICPNCQSHLRVIEIVTESEASKRAEQGLGPIPPP
jgi:hypothetical protein